MTIWFTGCTHFDHENIIKLAGRPFENVETMNQTLIHNWNSRVQRDDTVYHLGDVAWDNYEYFIQRLFGNIIILPGNHDHSRSLKRYEKHGARLAEPIIDITIEEQKFVLCHYPIEDWNKRYKGSIHLHCHTHSTRLRNTSLPTTSSFSKNLPDNYPADLRCNRMCVGVDSTAFSPISFEEIMTEARR